jgi:hypothetical protein
MAILDYCTGISQLVQNESTVTGDGSNDYVLESVRIYGSTTSLQARQLNLSQDMPDEFWCSFSVDGYSSWDDSDFFVLGDGDSYLVKLRATSGEDIEVYCNDGTSDTLVATILNGDIFNSSSRNRLDMRIDRENGGIDVYVNRGLQVSESFDFSGNLIVVNTCTLNYLRSPDDSLTRTEFSQIFFADEDSTLITMIQSQVESIGGYNDFSGTVDYVECISKTGDNNSMTSSSSGDKQSFNIEDRSSLVAGGDVVAVGVYCRINQDNSGNDQGRLLITDGAGNDVYSDYFTVDQYITPHRMIFETSPSGTAFDYSTVYNWQIGIEVSENG